MPRAWKLLVLIAPLAACKEPPEERHHLPEGSAERGRMIIERVGCGSCHDIPGVWPRGTLGPRLAGLADQGMIGGRLPNRPDLLAAFIRNAPALVPGTTMPAMPIGEREARDAAAYLYTLKRE